MWTVPNLLCVDHYCHSLLDESLWKQYFVQHFPLLVPFVEERYRLPFFLTVVISRSRKEDLKISWKDALECCCSGKTLRWRTMANEQHKKALKKQRQDEKKTSQTSADFLELSLVSFPCPPSARWLVQSPQVFLGKDSAIKRSVLTAVLGIANCEYDILLGAPSLLEQVRNFLP